jgi:hypothetical protein
MLQARAIQGEKACGSGRSKIELVINPRTAIALDLMQPAILLYASPDEVIE